MDSSGRASGASRRGDDAAGRVELETPTVTTVYVVVIALFIVLLFAIAWVSSDRFPHVRVQPRVRSEMERRAAMLRRERLRREKAEAAAPPEWDTADDLPVVEDPAA